MEKIILGIVGAGMMLALMNGCVNDNNQTKITEPFPTSHAQDMEQETDKNATAEQSGINPPEQKQEESSITTEAMPKETEQQAEVQIPEIETAQTEPSVTDSQSAATEPTNFNSDSIELPEEEI